LRIRYFSTAACQLRLDLSTPDGTNYSSAERPAKLGAWEEWTVKLNAVYKDGKTDAPLEATLTFSRITLYCTGLKEPGTEVWIDEIEVGESTP